MRRRSDDHTPELSFEDEQIPADDTFLDEELIAEPLLARVRRSATYGREALDTLLDIELDDETTGDDVPAEALLPAPTPSTERPSRH
ncbi:MAG TPA: hypothetical protein VM369_04855 [Candidatus Binatia bacterium]|nr:hypothetical protein [Candidatus Binatia bacterium]